ncbi:YchJ family metal-binding protein [Nonomuraea dietziae]|uniref:YchJ family metal-binding protein n=1 Tax=Nonomuraea dietziae TaxID=65515 RepID=UPI0031E176D7
MTRTTCSGAGTPPPGPAELAFEPHLRWKRLSVVATGAGGPADEEGTVEFRARFSRRGRAGEMREVSRFARHEGAWVYVNGEVRSSP